MKKILAIMLVLWWATFSFAQTTMPPKPETLNESQLAAYLLSLQPQGMTGGVSKMLVMAESGATTHTIGTLKGRGKSGRVFRITRMPIATITKANSVPILTSSPNKLIGTKAAITATTAPVTNVVMYGVRNLG